MSSAHRGVGGMCGRYFWVVEPNLDEVPGVAVDADVSKLQTDDLTGLSDDKSSTGKLWLRRHKGEVAISGQHVQTSYKPHTNTSYS